MCAMNCGASVVVVLLADCFRNLNLLHFLHLHFVRFFDASAQFANICGCRNCFVVVTIPTLLTLHTNHCNTSHSSSEAVSYLTGGATLTVHCTAQSISQSFGFVCQSCLHFAFNRFNQIHLLTDGVDQSHTLSH
jgi:hypothetical protein